MEGITTKRNMQLSFFAVLVIVVFGLLRRRRQITQKLLQLLFKKKSKQSDDWPGNVWLDQHREEALEPEMEIIDPHHHLWDPRFHPKGWPIPSEQIQLWYHFTKRAEINQKLVESMTAQNPAFADSFIGRSRRQEPMGMPYMGEELDFDIRNRGCGKRGHNVVKTVYLECGWQDAAVEEALRPVGEARMVEKVHAEYPKLCNGMVAHANLLLPDVETTLKALKLVPLVRGIRHALAWSDDPMVAGAGDIAKPGTAKSPQFRSGFALLAKYDLSYDVWMFHEQLEELTDLAKAFPNTTIILDHVAEPLGIGKYTREGTFPVWEKGMRELAKASKNVFVKLSGLGMCRPGFHWDDRPTPPSSKELADGWGPYFRVTIDAFGADRCMFASNFPVDRVSCDYTVMWNAFKIIAKDFSASEKRALFYETANRVYRL